MEGSSWSITSYCCNIFEAKDVSAALHSSEKQLRYLRRYSTYELMLGSRRRSSHVRKETTETRRRVIKLQKWSRFLAATGLSTRQREILDGKDYLLCEQLLAEKMCGEICTVVEDLYSMFTFEPFSLAFHGNVKTFENVFHSFYLKKIYSFWGSLPAKQKRLSSVILPLLKACIGVMAYNEKKHPVPVLHIVFATKEQAIRLNVLFTKEGI